MSADLDQATAVDIPRVRVCFVALQFWPAVGGAESRIEKQAHALLVLGHEVSVITLRHWRSWPRHDVRGGVPIIRLGGWRRRDGNLRIGRAAIWVANVAVLATLWRRRGQYDVIHLAQLSALAGPAALVGALTRTPVLIGIQNAGPDPTLLEQLVRQGRRRRSRISSVSGPASTLRPTLRKVLVHFDDVTSLRNTVFGGGVLVALLRRSRCWFQALSTRSRDRLIGHGFNPSRIVVIPGSVDVDRFHPLAGAATSPDSRPTVLCAARLEYNKGIDVLLRAWAAIGAKSMARPRPRLLLAGEGSLARTYEDLASDLGIAHDVVFLGVRDDVRDLLQSADVFVLPSRWEGMPNALLEAMATGLPCVATRVSGSEDILLDGENGLLVEPEEPEQLAGALCRVLADAALAQRLGQAARRTVVERYTVARVIEQCLALYQSLLDGTQALQ